VLWVNGRSLGIVSVCGRVVFSYSVPSMVFFNTIEGWSVEVGLSASEIESSFFLSHSINGD
jgi:hypothetical protein